MKFSNSFSIWVYLLVFFFFLKLPQFILPELGIQLNIISLKRTYKCLIQGLCSCLCKDHVSAVAKDSPQKQSFYISLQSDCSWDNPSSSILGFYSFFQNKLPVSNCLYGFLFLVSVFPDLELSASFISNNLIFSSE